MYPLNMQLPAPSVGFALANDEKEHEELNEAGFLPLLEKTKPRKKQEALENAGA